MIQIQVDQEEVRRLYVESIEEHLKKIDEERVFWNSNDLKRQTNLSWNTIQDEFFHHPDFPKTKVGNKWLYPSKETKEFLNKWFKTRREQEGKQWNTL